MTNQVSGYVAKSMLLVVCLALVTLSFWGGADQGSQAEWVAVAEAQQVAVETSSPTPPLSPTITTPVPPVPMATPTVTSIPQDSVFDTLIAPLAEEAKRRRAEFARTDAAYSKRVDISLNEGRVNFLLFGYGESHEPPATEKAIIGSQSILSYDIKSRKITVISLTHDIRAPEIEREFARNGFISPPVRIDQAYNVGGFKLMRLVLEDATGLAIDYQIAFKDVAIQDFVDSIFGRVEVDVPIDFDVHAFYLEGKKYDAGHFAKGKQQLTGRQVIQFIKTVPVAESEYDKSLEHNARKSIIFDALMKAVDKSYTDPGFWLKGSAFMTGQLLTGSIAYDFDPITLVIGNLGSAATMMQKLVNNSRTEGASLPKIDRSIYIVDPAHGDGGVQWVNANAAVNQTTKSDIDNGDYPSLDMEIPLEANPRGDLVTEYWPSVRRLVRETLGKAP